MLCGDNDGGQAGAGLIRHLRERGECGTHQKRRGERAHNAERKMNINLLLEIHVGRNARLRRGARRPEAGLCPLWRHKLRRTVRSREDGRTPRQVMAQRRARGQDDLRSRRSNAHHEYRLADGRRKRRRAGAAAESAHTRRSVNAGASDRRARAPNTRRNRRSACRPPRGRAGDCDANRCSVRSFRCSGTCRVAASGGQATAAACAQRPTPARLRVLSRPRRGPGVGSCRQPPFYG